MIASARREAWRLAMVALFATSSVAAADIRVVSDHPLSNAAAKALDIRWASADAVLVTTMAAGVLQVDTRDPQHVVSFAFAPANGGGCWSCARLGISPQYIATAFDVGQIQWKSTDSPQIHPALFDAVIDLDVHDDRLLLLGSRREEGEWAPDGAIAWTGTFTKGLSDLHPVLLSSLGRKATVVAKCGFLNSGAARFFSDGSYVIVPGVEPGAFLYDSAGRLLYTWQTDGLGFLDRCDLKEDDVLLYSANPEARAQWLARRVLIDDVLPFPEGPALILREVKSGVTGWSILLLRRGAPAARIALPLTSPSDVAHLKADLRGNRIAFLIRTFGDWRGKSATPARLVIAVRQ